MKTKTILLFLVLVTMFISVDAQNRPRNKQRGRTQRTVNVQRGQRQKHTSTTNAQRRQKQQNIQKKYGRKENVINNSAKNDTIDNSNVNLASETKIIKADYKSLNDPVLIKYIRGGYAKDHKLYLMANENYMELNTEKKTEVLNRVANEFKGYDINIYSSDRCRELWLSKDETVSYLEGWTADNLQIDKYMPLEMKRNGSSRLFYYLGGSFNGSDGYSMGSLNLRVGTYLYKNLIDASVTLNAGYISSNNKGDFSGDIGIDSRAYLPFKIKNFNFAPYLGVGISYAYTSDSYFELRVLAGGCWFLGVGSLDLGVQYGTKSDYAVTLGYTFRLPLKKKK